MLEKGRFDWRALSAPSEKSLNQKTELWVR
jgi:hypothetical protein